MAGRDTYDNRLEMTPERASRVLGSQESEWSRPKPLPDLLPSVPTFNCELIPERLRPFVEDTAERLQCPLDFIGAPMLVVLAALIGRKVRIAPKALDDWVVVPNLWGAIVGRPGQLKTPALNEVLSPIIDLEERAAKNHAEELIEFESRKLEWQARITNLQAKLKIDAKKNRSIDGQASDVMREKPNAPTSRRYMVQDATVEKLGEILNENPSGVLLQRDELVGFFRSMDKQGRESDRAFYLEAWNGNAPFTYDRIGRGTVRIEAATVSIFGCIQPGPLTTYLKDVLRGGQTDDGFLQRFQVVVWPDVPNKWRNIDRGPDLKARGEYRKLCNFLTDLDDNSDEIIHFSPDAQELFNKWREKLEQRLLRGDLQLAMEAHLSKYRSLVPSIALILQIIEGHLQPVSRPALARAIGWAEYLEGHANRLYATEVQPDLAAAHALLGKLRKGQIEDNFTARDVYRNGWTGLKTAKIVEEAVNLLQEHHVLRHRSINTGGAPSTLYQLNPMAIP